MIKHVSAAVLLATAIISLLDVDLVGGIIDETSRTISISPPNGTTVDTLPATFSCLVMENNEPVAVEWFVMGLPLDDPLFTEAEALNYTLSLNQENITIFSFFPPELTPNFTPVEVSCRLGLRSEFIANFTLIAPPPVAATVFFRNNETIAEGAAGSLCVDAMLINFAYFPFPLTVTLQVLPLSTAEASDYEGPIPSSLVLDGEVQSACFGVSVLMDDNDQEDVEFLYIQITNTSLGPNAVIDSVLGVGVVTIPCNENAVRLAGGMDSTQGRVEFCYLGEWGTVCSNGWDLPDAQVICRQFEGETSTPIAYTNLFGAVFGGQEIEPVLGNVQCTGNELSLVNCSFVGPTREMVCSGSQIAGVDCAGRLEPTFNFEPRESNLFIRLAEGGTTEVCVALVSGQITVPFVIEVRQFFEDFPGADFPSDFTFIPAPPPLSEIASVNLLFSPGDTRQCFTVVALDDSDVENREDLILEIVTTDRSATQKRIIILDNDMECFNGSRLCVNLEDATVRCLVEGRVCNGFMDCPDNSDETSCPECPEGMFNCLSERTCLSQSQVCDSFPDCFGSDPVLGLTSLDERDCPAGCASGTVDLVGGVDDMEGVVRVCMNDRYFPLSTEGLSILEASLICQDTGLGEAGYPTPSINLLGVQLISPQPFLAAISCPDSASSFSQCAISTTTGDSAQAAVRCLRTAAGCNNGDIRLSNGREGRVEVCYGGVWGAVLDADWSNRDAAVVCRQLGFPSQGAIPLLGAVYTYNEQLAFVAESISCVGNESALIDCPSPSSLGRPMGGLGPSINLFNVAGVRCDDYQPGNCSELDVRLTYRDATNYSGQVEVCRGGVWQRTCSPTFTNNDANVACNLLFGGSQAESSVEYAGSAEVISDTTPVLTELLLCLPGFSSFSACLSNAQGTTIQPPPTSEPCPPENQPTIRCRGPPVVYVSPELPGRMYTVEAGYTPSLYCLADTRVTPPLDTTLRVEYPGAPEPINIDPSEPVSVFRQPAAVPDSGFRDCVVSNSLSETRESLLVNVLGGEGEAELAFIQLSVVNSTRFSNIPEGIGPSGILPGVQNFFILETGVRTPGVQSINCAYIDSRPIDTERGLQRIECEISHFNRPDETETTTALAVANRLATLTPLIIPFIADVTTREAPVVAFSRPNSTGVEGDVITLCLSVVSGEITTPTSITFETGLGIEIDGQNNREFGIPTVGREYTISVPFTNIGEIGEMITFVVTFEPGQLQSCFDITLLDNDIPGIDVNLLFFSYASSSPTVMRENQLAQSIFILDNDRNCTAEVGVGSRLCVNTEILSLTCLDPSLVCDYQEQNCPDMSDELNCPSPLEDLINQTITEETYTNASATVSSFAAISANSTLLQRTDFLEDIATVFGNIANFVNSSNTTIINSSAVENFAATLNSLTQWEPSRLRVGTTSTIVESFETVATFFAQQSNLTVELTDIIIVVELGTTETFLAEGRTENFTNRAGVPASISLPPSLFGEVPADRPFIGVYFALYENPVLLAANVTNERENVSTVIGSPIVAATVGPGIDFVNLNPPVTITLGLLPRSDNSTANINSGQCVSWDFATDSWTAEGCETAIVDGNFLCSCTHLTNFAILIDICQRAQDCVNDPVADQILSIVTYIGVVVSCIGLIITVVTLLAFKKLRERDNSKYHIQLSIAIFCMLVVFAAGIGSVDVYAGCIIVSVLIHYFSLAAVMWMGAEALLMFQKLVIVFMRITTKFLVILSLVCWLFPLIPVLIPMIVDLANGTGEDSDLIITRSTNLTTNVISGFCFHKHPGVFFGAFLGPILAVILFNLVIFIWVIVVLIRHTRGQLERSKEGMKPQTALRLLISISGVMFLFGLTWLFAAFTFTIAGNNVIRITFQALFTVFASFQGFFIFLFFCVFNREARESWKELLSCGRYKSEFLHPSQYKNTSSAGTGTHRNKLKTGVTSSTSAYSTNAISKQTFVSDASPLPEKRDLEKAEGDEGIPLTATNGTNEDVSTFKDSPKDITESRIDGEEDLGAPSWSEAEPVKKARVKRYSTKKNAKHHIEEYELDFEDGESDNEEPPRA